MVAAVSVNLKRSPVTMMPTANGAAPAPGDDATLADLPSPAAGTTGANREAATA